MRDWCSSENYRFAARLYHGNKFSEAIPPNDSPWAAANGHTMAIDSQDRGFLPHSSNKLWNEREQGVIQATSSSFSGNLWLPCKDPKLSKFLNLSDSTVLYNGGSMMHDAGTLRTKDLLSGARSSTLQNTTQIPDSTERNTLCSGTHIIDSIVTRDSLYNRNTSIRDENIVSSGENSSVFQKPTHFSSQTESQGLFNDHSSVMHDGSRLDRGTPQCAKAKILQTSTQLPKFSKINVLDKSSWTRGEIRDSSTTHTNTCLSFRRESFFQSCTQFPNPTGNKNMNSSAGMMRDSSAMRNTSVTSDAGVINGSTWLPGENAIISHNCVQFPDPTEHKTLYEGTNLIHDTSFMRDLDTGVMDGNSLLLQK